MKIPRLFFCICSIGIASVGWALPRRNIPLIGQSEKIYTLAPENTEIRGLAFDGISPEACRLFVLDQAGKIFVYQLNQNPRQGIDQLKYLDRYELPADAGGDPPAGPRGLAYALENGQSIFYFLNWDDSQGNIKSQLWRCNFHTNTYEFINLSWYPFRIGDREVLDLTYDNGNILVSFDASGYNDQNLRVRRGIIHQRMPEWIAPCQQRGTRGSTIRSGHIKSGQARSFRSHPIQMRSAEAAVFVETADIAITQIVREHENNIRLVRSSRQAAENKKQEHDGEGCVFHFLCQ